MNENDPDADPDALSLILPFILNGEDIETRFSDIYRPLLGNIDKREAFLEALGILEAARKGSLPPLPGDVDTNLAFLLSDDLKPKDQ